MAARYSVYVALFVVVLVIICSRSSHGFPTNNKVEGDMDDTGTLYKGGGQSKQLLSNKKGTLMKKIMDIPQNSIDITNNNSEIVTKPKDKISSNQTHFKPEFVISPLSNLSNVNWFTDYTKVYNNRQQILTNYPILEHFIFTDPENTWNVNVLIETLELYEYRVQPCYSDQTSENKTNENSENDIDLNITSDNDPGDDDNSRNFTVDNKLYTEVMPEQPLKGIPDKILNKILALSNESQSVDTNNTFDRKPNNHTSKKHFEFLNSTQITILNETNYNLDFKFADNHNETLESIQLENRTQTQTNEQFESGTETRTDSIIVPNMATNAASQIQTICNNQNKNLNKLYKNDAKIKSALLSLSEQQIKINEQVNQHINYTNIFSEYDRAFNKLMLSNQDTLANQLQVLVTKLQEVITHMQQLELNEQLYGGYIQNRIAAVETHLRQGESAAKSIDTSQSEEYRVTNTTCNAQRRHLLGNSCYYIPRISAENLLFSWWDARYHCKQVLGKHGDLAVLETKQEMFDLTILLRSHFGDIDEFWLGASNLNSENNSQWNWVDGNQLDMNTLNDWGSTLILHSDNSCMAMYGSFQFHGEPCFYERYPVCEIQFQQS